MNIFPGLNLQYGTVSVGLPVQEHANDNFPAKTPMRPVPMIAFDITEDADKLHWNDQPE